MPSPTEINTPQIVPTNILIPSLTSSSTPDPAIQILFSPNGEFVAKLYDIYSMNRRPLLEKPVIEIYDKSGTLLWQIPYQGELPRSFPQPSLSTYKWSMNNFELYFYYSYHRDGGYTLPDALNLQKINIKTGAIEEVIPGAGFMAFAFSPDEKNIAYASAQDTQRKLVIRDLSTKSEKSISIDITSKEPIQIGWISWSPNSENVLFHVETSGQVFAFYLNTKTMKQKEILTFALEEYWFDSWTQDQKPRYIDYYKNISVVDIDAGEVSTIGTVTPTPLVK